jgi:spectinomycin phosphotransferase
VPAGPAAVLVPRHLYRCGLTAVVAALDTASGTAWLDVDGHQILVYPFVDGGSAWGSGFTDAQWLEYGGFLRALHGSVLPPDLAATVERERFDPPSLARVATLAPRVGSSPAQRELATLWRKHADRVAELAAHTAALRDRVRAAPPRFVLCHGDIHTGNVLVGPAGGLSIVDWDAPLMAPRERDLMYVLGGPWSDRPVTPRQRDLFRRAYGRHDVDTDVLAYYLCERTLDDIEQFARHIMAGDVTEDERRTDLHWLKVNIEQPSLMPSM